MVNVLASERVREEQVGDHFFRQAASRSIEENRAKLLEILNKVPPHAPDVGDELE